uniref:Candidate secreted effector n=1 Tax=Meloidogyne incognita TaxID=6306 RepID=A0A914LIU1_MELIC
MHQMTDDDGGLQTLLACIWGNFICPSLPSPFLFCGQNLLCFNVTTFLIFFHSVLCMLCNERSCCIWTSSICSRGGCGAFFSNIKSTSPLWHVAWVL